MSHLAQVGGRAGAVPQFRGGGAFAVHVFDEIERIWKQTVTINAPVS